MRLSFLRYGAGDGNLPRRGNIRCANGVPAFAHRKCGENLIPCYVQTVLAIARPPKRKPPVRVCCPCHCRLALRRRDGNLPRRGNIRCANGVPAFAHRKCGENLIPCYVQTVLAIARPPKRKPPGRVVSFWSRRRESNPRHQLGKLRFYH